MIPGSFDEMEYRALVWVHGLTELVDADGRRTGKTTIDRHRWSHAIARHPLVQQAEAEGWRADLAIHIRLQAIRAQMAGRQLSIEAMIPDRDWIAAQRAKAARFAAAAAWRETQPEQAPERRVDLDWQRAYLPGFERMRRESPNRGLHMTLHGLSSTTRRQTGEHNNE